MSRLRHRVIRAGLESMWVTGAHMLARPFLRGLGVILTMHRVRPDEGAEFAPNAILEIDPSFLEAVVALVRRRGLDIVDLDEAHRRLTSREPERRFVVFTLDDGYRDNREFAWPIFRRYGAPFTVFVPSSFPDGTGELWWLALEDVVARHPMLALEMDGRRTLFDTAAVDDKIIAYDTIYRWLWSLPEHEKYEAVRDLCGRYGVDTAAICRTLCMPWAEIADMANDPLVTIGAHTVTHRALARLDAAEIAREMRSGAQVVAAALGAEPRHFAYPYGFPYAAGPREFRIAAEIGFKTAVTTRPGVLYPAHADHLTALPRVSLNGDFQNLRYVDVLFSGLPTFVWNGFERMNVA